MLYYAIVKDRLFEGIFFAFFWTIPITAVILIVAGIAKNLSVVTEDRILILITKKDNSFWLNQYYDLSCSDNLRELTQIINNATYK